LVSCLPSQLYQDSSSSSFYPPPCSAFSPKWNLVCCPNHARALLPSFFSSSSVLHLQLLLLCRPCCTSHCHLCH
jgi:hypothetical protein